MTNKIIAPLQPLQVRSVQAKTWRGLALGAAVSIAATPGLADGGFKLELARDMGATLWTVQEEGGEGGEAGAIADASDGVAYLAQLSIVEGHLIAAEDLFAAGQKDAAIDLSYHPEAELMDEMRGRLASHQAQDFTPLMKAFSAAMESGSTVDTVNAGIADFRTSVAAAKAGQAADLKARIGALVLLVKAAAEEYSGSIENGSVTELMGYAEARAFLKVAREEATALQAQDLTKAAAGRVLDALAGADEAFGDLTAVPLLANDPAILQAVAARVELIASTVR